VVLRAQGSLRIEGVLRRASGVAEVSLFRAGETLSEWLLRARANDLDCTVLIAGGDLVVDGRVDVDGPLLLVAGGRIRVARRSGVRAARAWTLGEGSGSFVYDRPSRENQNPAIAPLRLDLATTNQLVRPLVYGVRSTPIPRDGEAARWYPAPEVGGHAGHGSFRVRYIGRGATGAEVAFDDPAAFYDSPTLRLEILLEVPPGKVWDPPWIDSVQVGWEPRTGEEGR
jgi:hypothetical protein